MTEFYDDLEDKLIQRLKSQKDNYRVGIDFEIYTAKALQNAGWYVEYPLTEYRRQVLGLPSNGEAIDMLISPDNEKWYLCQVKFTSHKTFDGDLTTFSQLVKNYKSRKNVCRAPAYLICNKQITKKCINDDPDIEIIDLNLLKSYYSQIENEKHLKPHQLRDYQADIVNKVLAEFNLTDRAHFILPCGAGKTLIGIEIALRILKGNSEARIALLAPTLDLTDQITQVWSNVFEDRGQKFLPHYLQIGSHSETKIFTTDKERLERHLAGSGAKYVFSTYHSSALLLDHHFDLVIFDEAHRTNTATNKPAQGFTALLNSKWIDKRLFMTATPRVLKFNKNLPDDYQTFSFDNQDIYGRCVAKYNIRELIQRGYLANYEVICLAKIIDNSRHLQIGNYQYKVRDVISSLMILEAIKEYELKKMMVFANTHKQLLILNELLIHFEPKIKVLVADENIVRQHRTFELANEFEHGQEVAILLSCNVFLEGKNIVDCDSIFYHSAFKSSIKIKQSLGRALRYKLGKVAKILIPFMAEKEEDFYDFEQDSYKNLRQLLISLHDDDPLISEHFRIHYLREHISLDKETASTNTLEIPSMTDLKLDDIRQAIIFKIIEQLNGSDYVSKIVKNLRLTWEGQYVETAKRRPDLPADPTSETHWQGWFKFLGHSEWNFKSLTEIKALNFNHINDYLNMAKNDRKLPFYFSDKYGKPLNEVLSNDNDLFF